MGNADASAEQVKDKGPETFLGSLGLWEIY